MSGPDVTVTRVYFPGNSIQIHLNRVLPIPPHLPAYFYLYGRKCKSPEQPPKWVEKMLNGPTPSVEDSGSSLSSTEQPRDATVSPGNSSGVGSGFTVTAGQELTTQSGVTGGHEIEEDSETLNKPNTHSSNHDSSGTKGGDCDTEQDSNLPSREIGDHGCEDEFLLSLRMLSHKCLISYSLSLLRNFM